MLLIRQGYDVLTDVLPALADDDLATYSSGISGAQATGK
jgi:hypothetical protein